MTCPSPSTRKTEYKKVSVVFAKCEFDHGHQCPICGKDNAADAVLVAIHGTGTSGGTVEAALVHVACLAERSILYPADGLAKAGVIGAVCEYPHQITDPETQKSPAQ